MIGILGGTFDPIHFGHLRPALEVMAYLELREVRFIPCHIPPHRRTPLASGAQRCAMVERAIAGQAGFMLDQRELARSGPSYSVDTLHSVRAECGPGEPLCLLMGMDAFAGLRSWYRWEAVLSLAHIVVAHRPGHLASCELEDWVSAVHTQHPAHLRECPAGRVLFHAVTQMDISASTIRHLLAQGHNPRYLLPDAVLDYIAAQGLYRHPQTAADGATR